MVWLAQGGNSGSLEALSLDNNAITDEGFETLMSYLQNISTISTLHIQNNQITGRCLDSLSDFVSKDSL